MDDRWADLAARLGAAAEDQRASVEDRAARRETRLAEGRAARAALLDDLEAFAAAVGPVTVIRDGEGLTWRVGDRVVHFEPRGDGDRLAVTWRERTPLEGRLYREPVLGDRWVLAVTHRGQEDRVPLFEAGLTRWVVEGLRLVAQPPADGGVAGPGAASSDAGSDEPAPEPRPRGRRL